MSSRTRGDRTPAARGAKATLSRIDIGRPTGRGATIPTFRRNAKTFAVIDTKQITRGGQPVPLANELECVGDFIWANIYRSLQIVKIDKRTGAIVAEVDGTRLVPPGVNAIDPDHVLNGIAFNEKSQTSYVTGKLWPEMLEVGFK